MGTEKLKIQAGAGKVLRQAKSCPPACYYHRDCFAFRRGLCMVLYSNDFDGGECPFYRSRSGNREEQEACMRRLVRIGRRDLLDKYAKYHAVAGAFAKDYTDGVADEILTYRNSSIGEEDRTESVE